jgi:transposase
MIDPTVAPPASQPHLGIDVSKLTFDVHFSQPDGSTRSSAFSNDKAGFKLLDNWLKAARLSTVCAGLEATGSYGDELLEHLYKSGHRVYMLNPRRVKDFARSQGTRVKTDRTDAAIICAYIRASSPLKAWEPPAAEIRELQALVRRRSQLLDLYQAERNHCEKRATGAVADSIARQLVSLQSEIKHIDKVITKHISAHPCLAKKVEQLRTIHGIGQIVAITILAEVPAMEQFARAREVASFAGVTPLICQSGTSVKRRGCMSKEGSRHLRKVLYMAALQAVKRSNNAFHSTYRAHVARGKSKMCAIGAIMHKLIRVAYGVLKHQRPFDPSYNPSAS